MTPVQAAYLRRETLISAAINLALSVAFTFLAFGGQARIGWAALAWDALPQSFAITLMATLVPTLLTRKRLRTGTIAPLSTSYGKGRHNAFVRALILALVATAIAGLLHYVLLPLGPAKWSFAAVLAYKSIYGALLGAGIGHVAVRSALASGGEP
jgi:hypothetical protein